MKNANLNEPLTTRILDKYYIWTILVLFYILFILSLGVSIYLSKNTANKITADYNEFTNNTVTKLNLLAEIRKNIFIVEDATLKHIFLTDSLQMNQEKTIISSRNKNQINLKKYKQYISSNQEQKLYNALLIKRDENIRSREKIINLSTKNKIREALSLYNKTHQKKFNDTPNILTSLIDLQIEKANKKSDISSKHIHSLVHEITLLISFSILIVLIIGFLIYRTFKRTVNDNKKINYQKSLSEALIESGPDAIIGTDENEEILLFNKQAENIFGFERNQVLHKKYQFLLGIHNDTIIGIRKNGKKFPIEINKSHLLNDDKTITIYSIRDISEKYEIIQTLKDNEEKFRNVFESSHTAILLTDGINYIDCNKKALKLYGLKNVNELKKHKVFDLSPEFQPNGEKSADAFKEISEKTLESGYYSNDWQIKTLDGNLIFTEILISSYFYQGKMLFQINVNDISDRKKTAAFIKGVNKAVNVKTGRNYFFELTQFLINYTKVKYVYIGTYLPEKDTIETISFRDSKNEFKNITYELISAPCEIVLKSEDFCCFPTKAQSIFPKSIALKTMNIDSFLGIRLKFNGNIEGIIVLMDDKPMIAIEEKKKILSFITARSINELKQRNIFIKLRESRSFNRGILSSLNSHIAVIDGTGEILSVNRAWRQFALQNGGNSYLRNEKKANYIEVCEKAAAGGDAVAKEVSVGIKKIFNGETNGVTIEYPCHSPTEERWFELKAMPFGKIESENKIVITHRNITDKKIAEQKQEIQNLELLKTNSELDQFVYSISHDLRAPLTSMLGLIDLSYDCKIQQRLELLGMMKHTVVKLDDLITDILIYSRNKNTLIENEEIDFQKLINTTRNNHLYMDGTENIAIDVVTNQKSTFVSDKIRITYTLNNLFSNAIKYSDSTKINSFLNISIISDDKKALITFEDNGIGIAKKDSKRIFEMFYRSTTIATGSGLGLYILKESVKKMKGEINLKSEPGKGSIFTISIPNLITK